MIFLTSSTLCCSQPSNFPSTQQNPFLSSSFHSSICPPIPQSIFRLVYPFIFPSIHPSISPTYNSTNTITISKNLPPHHNHPSNLHHTTALECEEDRRLEANEEIVFLLSIILVIILSAIGVVAVILGILIREERKRERCVITSVRVV